MWGKAELTRKKGTLQALSLQENRAVHLRKERYGCPDERGKGVAVSLACFCNILGHLERQQELTVTHTFEQTEIYNTKGSCPA